MLSNAYFVAKFRFDTAENEPAKNLQNFRKMHFSKILQIFEKFGHSPGDEVPAGDGGAARALQGRDAAIVRHAPGRVPRRSAAAVHTTRRPIGKISAKCCSFSAVSAPIFARKYAFCSIFQNLSLIHISEPTRRS